MSRPRHVERLRSATYLHDQFFVYFRKVHTSLHHAVNAKLLRISVEFAALDLCSAG